MFTFDVPPKLLRQIARYEREDLLDKLVGLGVSPEYQANATRIETLIHIGLITAQGVKRATRNDLAKLLNGFEAHAAVQHENPAEDVFVSTVSTATGQFRIFNGIYQGADYSLQRLLDAVLAQDFEYRDSVARPCDALLRLSEAVAERCGFAANEFAESRQWRTSWPLNLPLLLSRGTASRFTHGDLIGLGIDIADLEPFCVISLDGLLDASFGGTLLNRWPLIAEDNGVHLPIPSYISPALRLYLAHAIADSVVPRKATETFHDNEFTRWVGVHLPLHRAKPLEIEPLDLPEPDLDTPHLTQAVLRFDEDKVAHLIVLGCSWRNPPERNIHESHTPSAYFQKNLANYLRMVRDKLFNDMGVSRGLTLVVQDSPGWSTFIQLPEDFAEHWYCTGFPARIFAFLLADHAFSLIDLWKMLREVRELEAKGVRMMAWPDILNYWSIWRALGSTFWVPTVDLRTFGGFAPDTSKIVEVVWQIRLATNPHATPLPNGEWLRVERWVEELSPSQDYTKPIYLDPFSIVLGELRAVVETQYGPWWVASARPPFDPQDRQLIYLIWQAATEWLLRIAQSAFSRLPASTQPLEIRLLTVPETILDAPDEIEFVRAKDMAVVTIILPPRFPDRLMTVDNAGERLLIDALIEGILTVLNQSLPDKEKSEWLAEVAENPDLKMIHITAVGDHGFAADLIAERLSFRFLQQSDLAAAKRFMREALELIPASGVTMKTSTVSGEAATHAVLHAAVDLHWHRCKTILNSLDREQTLILVSRLIEALHRERVSSERGALARLQHYAESPEYSDIARITVGRRDRSFLAYRVVAEMALCECPLSGGRVPGLTDIDKLAGEIAELIAVAHDSDAVARGLIDPELSFRADGAIEPADGGATAFIQSYILACLSESIALDVDAYQTLFELDAKDTETLLREDDPFMLAFQAEFGLDLRKSVEISSALQSIAVGQKKDVVTIRRSQLETLLAERSPSIDGAALSNFLNAFGLSARSAWDSEPTAPYNRSDVWPWLFERRLSLMLRPVLIVPGRVCDPLLIFGVRQIDMGVRYASTLLETGGWPKEKLSSEAGRVYIDQEVNRRGRAFEVEVAELMRRGGWKAIESLLMKRLGAPKQLGDLDVLAVSKDGRRWWVIECKWFGAARTPREIANWLQDFRGHDGDKLDRHLKRLAWIREHRKLVTAQLELPSVPEAIEPKIVTTSPVPLELQKHLPSDSDVLTKRNLIDLLSGQCHA
jgi:hypothetical protein